MSNPFFSNCGPFYIAEILKLLDSSSEIKLCLASFLRTVPKTCRLGSSEKTLKTALPSIPVAPKTKIFMF